MDTPYKYTDMYIRTPVTISDRVFEQTFITAEGILGMGFLEAISAFLINQRQIIFEQLQPLSLVSPSPS